MVKKSIVYRELYRDCQQQCQPSSCCVSIACVCVCAPPCPWVMLCSSRKRPIHKESSSDLLLSSSSNLLLFQTDKIFKQVHSSFLCWEHMTLKTNMFFEKVNPNLLN